MKIKSGFSDYSATQLADLGDAVGPNVALNPKFAAITPTPAEIAANVMALRFAIVGTGPGAKTALTAAMATLASALSTLADNIMQTPGVTDTDLAGTDFPILKERVRTTAPPAAPGNLRLRHGNMPGQVVGTCDPAGDNVRGYEGQWTLDPNAGPWNDLEPFPNSRAVRGDDLPRGKDIWMRTRARNAVGAGPWSDPATIMVT